MKRSTANVVWTVVVVVLLLLGLAAAVFGPRLYREAKALVGPIAELAASKKAMEALDEEYPFEPPAGGIVSEARMEVFLATWEDLLPRYTAWQDLVNEVEGGRTQSWEEAKKVLAATRDVHLAQREVLRARGMSPNEFVWIEDAALSWWRQVEPQLSDADRPAIVAGLRRAREKDLRVVGDLERRHGSSPALDAMERHLEAELTSLDASAMPEATDVPEENQELFWRHRERLAAIEGATHNPLHEIIREKGGVTVTVDDDGRPFTRQPESPEQD